MPTLDQGSARQTWSLLLWSFQCKSDIRHVIPFQGVCAMMGKREGALEAQMRGPYADLREDRKTSLRR